MISDISDPHVIKAIEYCKQVISGEIITGALTQAACKRQLEDLERPDFPFVFDESRAGRPCRFLETLPHVKGPKANRSELIKLEPWQCFIVTTIYGWIRRDTGKRRFRRAYIEVARGNAKSTMLAGLALYALAADNEEGAEVVSAATTREQARIVFGVAQGMLRRRRDLGVRLGIRDTQHAILQERTNSRFVPLSREADNQDGLNIHFACVDELHAHRTREVYDVLETALGKRDQSLLCVITTAGTDTSGICYELRTYVSKILNGSHADDAQFGVIYTIDETDDWTDAKVWPKANPNFGVSVQADIIEGLALKAKQVASAQNNFRTKHLNVWCSADTSWLNLVTWDACGDPTLDIEDFRGEDCWMAFDLASRSDMAARVLLFARDPPKGKRQFYLFAFCYLPEDTVRDATNASYRGWVTDGWIQTTPGPVLDFASIKADTLLDRDRFRIVEAPYDPYQATQFAGELLEEGVNMVEFRQTVLGISPAMKELEALVLEGRLHHNANPCLRWQISNVVCHRDAKDNIYPRKMRPELKIDAAVGAIMAIGRAMTYEPEPDVYSVRGFLTF